MIESGKKDRGFRKTTGGLICPTTILSKELLNSFAAARKCVGGANVLRYLPTHSVCDDTDLKISLNLFYEVALKFLKRMLKDTITGLILQRCSPLPMAYSMLVIL